MITVDVAAERAASLERQRQAIEAHPGLLDYRAGEVLEYALGTKCTIAAAASRLYSRLSEEALLRIVERAGDLRAIGAAPKRSRRVPHDVRTHKAEKEALRAVVMETKRVKKRKWEATMPEKEARPRWRPSPSPSRCSRGSRASCPSRSRRGRW